MHRMYGGAFAPSARNMSAWHQSTLNIVNQALDNSSIYCCCCAIQHGQIIYEKPNENLWKRLTLAKFQRYFWMSSHLFASSHSKSSNFNSFLFSFRFSFFSLNSNPARTRWCIHENAVRVHISVIAHTHTLSRSLSFTHSHRWKRMNNKNWRQNIEWLFYCKQQGIHTCVWQFWCGKNESCNLQITRTAMRLII